MANDHKKIGKRQARLFSTLASLERTDRSATKRRRQSHRNSLQQSAAAAEQTKVTGILLELRILTQRCLTEERGHAAAGAVAEGAGGAGGGGGSTLGDDDGTRRAKDEVDALLENLLMTRRELVGHRLGGADEPSDSDNREEVDYATLIRQADNEDTTSNDDASSTDDDSSSNNSTGSPATLAKQLDSEYLSLQTHWKSVLNKHHANLALHSGLSANSSKFQSKAVDVAFWEQVQGVIEHERFKQLTASAVPEQRPSDGGADLHFDDSKLYQHLLKDVIAFSQANGASASRTNKKGLLLDPAQEAAARLQRAMRKKSGGAGEMDLTALLTATAGGAAAAGGGAASHGAAKKATVDRKASKGRKLRYGVHAKMVNFTFPVARAAPMIREEVWFKSLFGGAGKAR